MKVFGKRAAGERLERIRASAQWLGEAFGNRLPILPGLRDHSVPRPTLSEFLCGGRQLATSAGPRQFDRRARLVSGGGRRL